ncbi:Histone H1 [Cytospora mali]|uniref:Histone H1 n=1 Tax=Cytospora mali TaxID=578113 RepID=A0A194VB54_CYTMA|nr:Histone H1 [Valsa mali var. pyri (nom. inval.)]
MPPKKTEGAATKTKAPASHPSYQDMISEAITQLKDRNGSSRQSLKKYVKANYNIQASTDAMFDSLFNRALKKGVETGHFVQPKGASGGTKLAKKSAPVKKEAAAKEKKPAAEKKEGAKKPAAKKAAPKKEGAAATKKAAAPKKAAASTTKKAAPKKKTEAPAVVDKPTALTKTKSGRVAKTTAAKPAAKKAAAPKKAAPKKEKTPKKAAAASPTAA